MKATGMKMILLFLFCLFISVAFSQKSWRLARDESGIRVYQKDSKNSNFKSIRVECTLEGSFDKLISIINNISRYKDWVYNNKTTSLLKRISAYEFYYYTEAYLPWPLDNRDAVMHTKISRDSSERFLQINSVAVPNYIPSKSGKVRIQRSDINWYVTRPSSNALHIVYTFEADPGGSVPAWLVNSFADKGPFESFKKLGELLKKR
jgi:hypothetical protein